MAARQTERSAALCSASHDCLLAGGMRSNFRGFRGFGEGLGLGFLLFWCVQVLGEHSKAESYRAARALRGQAMEQLMLDEHRWHDLLLEAEPGWQPVLMPSALPVLRLVPGNLAS